MPLTKVFNRMNGSVYSSAGDVPAGLAVGITITVAGIDKIVVSSGQDETVNGNLLRNLVSGNVTVREKSAAYTATVIDSGALIRSTATMTLSLTAAATLGSGWFVDVLASTGTLVIDPNGAETIDGAATLAVLVGNSCRIRCNGSAFYSQFLDTDTGLLNVVEDVTPQLGGPLDANAQQINEAKGADVASAAALTLGADGNFFDITGTTGITSIVTRGIGTEVTLQFDGILTLTHHASDLILLNGEDIVTYAGYVAVFREYAVGDWVMVSEAESRSGWQDVEDIFDFDVNGSQASMESSTLIDGFEYRIKVDNLKNDSAGTPDLQVEFYRETDAAYHTAIPLSATVAPTDYITGEYRFHDMRVSTDWKLSDGSIYEAASEIKGTNAVSAILQQTYSIANFVTAQKVSKLRVGYSTDNMVKGVVTLQRRRL